MTPEAQERPQRCPFLICSCSPSIENCPYREEKPNGKHICHDKFTVNCAPHSSATSADAVLEIVRKLYDAGFSNPLVTVECALAYLENPSVPGHPEKQRIRQQKGA